MFLQVDNRELATILAALRYYGTGVCLDARTATLLSPKKSGTWQRTAARWNRWTKTRSTNSASGSIANPLRWSINWLPRWSGRAPLAIAKATDYDWAGEVENVLDAAYAAGLGPKVSAPLKRLLMAEIDNVEGDDPATLETVKDSLDSGYRPYDKFPVGKVKKELADLIGRIGGTVPAKRFVTTADWQERAKV